MRSRERRETVREGRPFPTSPSFPTFLRQMLLDLAFQRSLGHSTNYGVHVLPVLKEEDAWDGPNVEAHGGALVRIHIHLCDFGLSGVLAGQLLQNRRHDLTGTTPGCPEVNQHEPIRLLDFGGERGIAYMYCRGIRRAHLVILL